MVEVVTGSGLGLERTSALVLGGAGTLGSAATGTAGVGITVNADTGNLVIEDAGETLQGLDKDGSLSAVVNQTYNSLGQLNGTNNTTWAAQGAQIVNLTGTLNTAGSTVQRIGWDGSIVTYAYSSSYKNADGTTGAYLAKENGGAYDSLTNSGVAWTWHDRTNIVNEFYGATGNRVSSRADHNGNKLTFAYTGNLITQITTADGEYVSLVYSGNNLVQLTTHLSGGATLTRTYYGYDIQNRLTSAIVDLSPNDNSVADGNVYTTNYSYVGTSNLVASVKQTDGSEVDFTYDASNRVASIKQWVNSTASWTTSFTYGLGSTTVTDPQGNQTVLSYDANGNLLSIAAPAVSGGSATFQSFTYDANGNVLTSSVYASVNNAASGSPLSQITNTYDASGNLLSSIDLAGNTTSYTYNQFNEVLTKTVYTVPTQGSTAASGAEITFYTYDTSGNLRFVVSSQGDVTYYSVNSQGQTASVLRYTSKQYNTVGLSAPISYATMASWQASLTTSDKQAIERTDYTYDFRGNLASETSYSADTSTGTGATASPFTQTTYVYDQAGNLLSKLLNDGSSTQTYVYDGLGRITLHSDAAGNATQTTYNDAADAQTITYANGLMDTLTYDKAGELLSSTHTGSGITTTTTSYLYDGLGNLRVATDPSGVNTYYFYDADNRKVGEVDGAGFLTRFTYDAANRVIASVTYATPLSTAQLASLAPSNGVPSSTTLASITPSSNAADAWSWSVYDAASRIIETINAVGSVTIFSYDGTGALVQQTSYANALSASQIAGLIASPPASQILPTANASLDRTTRSFYNSDGLLIGTLDAQGYLSQIDYDAAGRKIDTIAYATQASSSLWASGSFSQLQASVGTSAQDEHSYFLYDDRGFLAATIDPVGDLALYTYTAGGEVASKTTGQQVTPNTAYTLASLPAASGSLETTAYTYDGDGRVLTLTRGQGSAQQAVTTYTYDAAGNVTSVTDGRGYKDTTSYDVLGRVLQTSVAVDGNSADNLITRYTYDTRGNKTSVTDPRGNTSYFYYDNDDRLVLAVDANGHATATSYLGASTNIASVTHYATVVAGAYNATTWPTITTSAGDATTSFTYDAAGRLTSTTDANGASESYVLDSFGDRVQLTNKLQGTTTYAYDGRGLLLSETIGETSSFGNGSTEANTVTNVYKYDAFGNMKSKVEAQGLAEARTTLYTYDNLNRLTVQMLSLGSQGAAKTLYQYDGNGNVVLTTDPNGNQKYEYYDALNRKVGEVSALGVLTTYAYDGNGNLVTRRDYAAPLNLSSLTAGGAAPAGTGTYREIDYTYDGANRLLTTTVLNVTTGWWNGTSYSTWTGNLVTSRNVYDASGDVIQSIDGNGNSTYYFYDATGVKMSQVDADGYLTVYINDANGNVVQETRYATQINLNALSTQYGVSIYKLTQIQMWNAAGSTTNDRITQFTYDRNGNRLTETRLNVASATVSTTTDAIATATASAAVTYTYNALGEVLTKTEATGDTTGYTYDAQGRLISTVTAETVNAGQAVSTSASLTTTEAYNGLNNVMRNVTSGVNSATRVTTYTYGAGGRLASMTGPGVNAAETLLTTWYTYDKVGNLVLQQAVNNASDAASGTADLQTAITYDALNRAVTEQSSYLSNGSWVAGDTMGTLYDAFGEVVGQTINGTQTTQSVYDNAGHLIASNNGDGTWKAYLTDATGNATLTIQSLGSTDLSSFLASASSAGIDTSTYNQAGALALATNNGANAAGAAVGNGVEVTIGVFDARNQQLQTIQPQRQIDTSGALHTIITSATYDAFGDVASQTDARGNTTTYIYNTEGKVTSQIAPQVTIASGNGSTSLGNPTSYDYYDLSGRLIATRDADGNLLTRSLLAGTGYNGAQALETAEYHADGGITHSTYDVYGDVLTQTDALGYITTNSYDNSGNLIQVNHPSEGVTSITTASGSKTVSYTGAALWVGETITGTGIASGATVLSINAAGTATISAAATASGNISINSQLINDYAYDGRGEQVSEWNNVVVNTTATAATIQLMTSGTTLAAGQSVYSPDGRFQLIYQNDGNLVLYAVGGVALWASGTNGATAGSAVMQADGNLVVYNASGSAVWASGTSGNSGASLLLNDTGVMTINAASGTQLWSSPFSGQSAIPFGLGYASAVSSTAYDSQGRVISTTDAMGLVTNYSYAWNASLATSGLGAYGGWTKTINDVASGLSSNGSTDAFGHEIAKTDLGGHVYTFTFNKAGELVGQSDTTTTQSSISTGGEVLAYTYYNDGKVATIADSSGTISSYFTSKLLSTFTYDVAGNRLTSNYTSTTAYVGYLYGDYFSGNSTTTLENATATYDALNRIISIADPGASNRPSYTQTKLYDANGNIVENKAVHQNIATNQAVDAQTTDDYWYAYDSMNRVVVSQGELSGTAGASGTTVVAGTSGTLGDANIQARTGKTAGTAITYNVDGEEATSTTYTSSQMYQTVRYSKYDQQSVLVGTYAKEIEQIYTDNAQGYLVETDVADNSATINGRGSSATLAVNPLGSAVQQEISTRDVLGRIVNQTEYNTTANDNGTSLGAIGAPVYSETYHYNNDSQITNDLVSVVQVNLSTGAVTNTVTSDSYNYGAVVTAGGTRSANSYTLGDVINQSTYQQTYSNSGGTGVPTATTTAATNLYVFFDTAEQSSISYTYSGSQSGTTTSTFYYDHNGNVSQVTTTGQNAHTNTYTTSAAGLVMANDEILSSGSNTTSAPETFYYYFNDRLIGQIGNNGNSNTNYSTSITNQTSNTGQLGPFSASAVLGTESANFDENYNAINATGNGGAATGSSYTVQSGDTLSSIAQKVLGDASLWYVIANANGLNFNSSLSAGQVVSIPNAVVNTGNTSTTFKPYNANAALGDVQPGAPIPPAQSGGCGGLGAVLLAVVAIAVTAIVAPELIGQAAAEVSSTTATIGTTTLTLPAITIPGTGLAGALGATAGTLVGGALAGAVGSIASQGVGVATGLQGSINWGSVGLAALSAGVIAGVANIPGLGGGGAIAALERGVVSGAITQGVGVATGLQDNFDWAAVAASGIGATVGSAVGGSSFGRSLYQFGDQLVSGAAGALASAATRSVLTGTDFGDNIMATLPQSIANTIGNAIASGINSQNDTATPQTGSGTGIGLGLAPIQVQLPPDPLLAGLTGDLLSPETNIDLAEGAGQISATQADTLRQSVAAERMAIVSEYAADSAPLTGGLGYQDPNVIDGGNVIDHATLDARKSVADAYFAANPNSPSKAAVYAAFANNSALIDEWNGAADAQINELMRFGNPVYDVGAGLYNIASGNAALRDYLSVGGPILGGVAGKVVGFLGEAGAVAAETAAVGEGGAAGRQVLYHYTNEAGVAGITDSNSLNPSLWKVGTKDVRYGNGQYVSDIVPGTRTPAELSRDFLGQPFQGSRFTHYVEIDATGLGAVQGRAGVYVIPNETPLDLTGRLLSSGKVPVK